MSNATALRIFDRTTDTRYIVQGDKVYADRNGDGNIAKSEEVGPAELGKRHGQILDGVRYLNATFDPRVPGNTTVDRSIVSEARLNQVELSEFERNGTIAKRPLLREHLSFFDPEGKGKFGLVRNYQGWRNLKWSVPGALKQTVSGFIFPFLYARNQENRSVLGSVVSALMSGGVIELNKIGRPSGSTGIFDKHENIDEAEWAEFAKAFAGVMDTEGLMSIRDAKRVLEEQVKLGKIPGKQFDSLFKVATDMHNGAEQITLDEIRSLYDGSILWRAVSLTDDEGHRVLDQMPK